MLTSNAGWNTAVHQSFLKDVVAELKSYNVRTSLFIDPDEKMIEQARETGTDRIELYTEMFAKEFYADKKKAIELYARSAAKANELKLGINAGHDLKLDNLKYFKENIPGLLEVSIGHALIADALELGMSEAVRRYMAICQSN